MRTWCFLRSELSPKRAPAHPQGGVSLAKLLPFEGPTPTCRSEGGGAVPWEGLWIRVSETPGGMDLIVQMEL